LLKQPRDPARKVIYQLDRKTKGQAQGRKPYETLQEWFQRIGLEADTHTYEQVRYGERRADKADIKRLIEQINDWLVK